MEQGTNSERTAKKGRGRPFAPGQSGNPGGRPRIPQEVKEMLRAATKEAAALLIATMRDEGVKPELRINCANEILNRVYGKSTQPLEGSVEAAITLTLAPELEEYAQ